MANRIPIADQINTLAAILGLDPSSALAYAQGLPECPKYAEGWFAIPTVEALARRHFPEATSPSEQHCRAIRFVMNKLGESLTIQGYREELVIPDRIRQHEHTTRSLKVVSLNQPGDIIVIAAQTGWFQRAKDPMRAQRGLATNEFGLDTVALASLALTHQDPFTWWKQRSVNCLGDLLDPGGQAHYGYVPVFVFMVQQGPPIETRAFYSARWEGDSCMDGGSATGFITH